MESNGKMITRQKIRIVALFALMTFWSGCGSNPTHDANVTKAQTSAEHRVLEAIDDLKTARDAETQQKAAEQFRQKYGDFTKANPNYHGWSVFLFDDQGNVLDRKKVSEQRKAVWVMFANLYDKSPLFPDFKIRLLSQKTLFIFLLPD
jgi:hypothetical protein